MYAMYVCYVFYACIPCMCSMSVVHVCIPCIDYPSQLNSRSHTCLFVKVLETMPKDAPGFMNIVSLFVWFRFAALFFIFVVGFCAVGLFKKNVKDFMDRFRVYFGPNVLYLVLGTT